MTATPSFSEASAHFDRIRRELAAIAPAALRLDQLPCHGSLTAEGCELPATFQLVEEGATFQVCRLHLEPTVEHLLGNPPAHVRDHQLTVRAI